MDYGLVYVAYGEKARTETRLSIKSLRNWHGWPVSIIGDEQVKGGQLIKRIDTSGGLPGRWAKVNLDLLSPYNHTLFLDADTRIYASLWSGFDALKQGWDLVMVASKPQTEECLGHLCKEERDISLYELPLDPLQLNTGVMWFQKSPAVRALFAEWRKQWARWKQHDQGALLRALQRVPVKLWLLGWPYNGGAVIGHRFGMCGR